MLKSLYVKNFVLIDEIQLEFSSGMSSFTGETGAGKSILLDAISLLAGARINSAIVRTNTEKAIVEGVFEDVSHPVVFSLMNEAGIEIEEGQLIVRREISKDGKSIARVNQTLVTASFLRDIVSQLLDLHSQHETQYLLQPKYHLELLDEFHGDKQLVQTVTNNYLVYKKYVDDLNNTLKISYNEEDLDFFTAQLNEIDEYMMEDGEEEELDQKLKEASTFEQTLEELQASLEILDGERQISSGLYEASSLIKHTSNSDLLEISERLNDLHYQVEEEIAKMRDFFNRDGWNQNEIERMHERKSKIISMKRKYGISQKDWLQKKQNLEDSIAFILRREHFITEMETKIEDAHQLYQTNSKKLSEVRKKASLQLEKVVLEQLQGVLLKNARFVVMVDEQEDSLLGNDHVRFMISMNPGEQLQPLHRVASGGELSRFMLAMKVIFTKLKGIDTVIFDEIDSGVSGHVAFLIGKKMNELGNDSQVFAVTHLAPVAAWAKHQYRVYKEQSQTSTHTYVVEMDKEERINELAMMATGTISESSKASAEELFNKSQMDSNR